MVDVLVVQVQFPSASAEETAELPQLQLVEALDKVVACPLCATTGAAVAQFIKVVDVPVIMRVDAPQIQFIAGVGGHSSSQQRQVLGFQQGGYGGDEGGFRGFPHFFALLQVPGVEPQFSEPSMAKSSLPSRAPLPICFRVVSEKT